MTVYPPGNFFDDLHDIVEVAEVVLAMEELDTPLFH